MLVQQRLSFDSKLGPSRLAILQANTHTHTHLTNIIFREQNVPCSQIAMDEPNAGQVHHPTAYLSTET